jgi:putative Mn2+ efflux pump MntP
MKEAILLIFVAASSIFILGYSIHMLIGGLVAEATEQWIIVCACLLGTVILAFLGWDIIRQRRLR